MSKKKSLGDLVVGIGADTREIAAELKKAQTSLKKLGKTSKAVNEKIDSSFEKSAKSIKKFSASSIKSFSLFAAAAATAFAVKGLVDVITRFEKLQASLRTVTGSAEAAEKAFDKLKKFAATTPFQLTEVTAAFIKMKALGIDPSEAALRSYGNTATAMGKSLNQMIEAVADAVTGEFERLKEFGIKAKQQGDNVTLVFQGVSTTVQKNAEEISGFLKSIGDVQFAGAMDQQADSLNVAISNMGDAFDQLAQTIGDSGVTELFRDITLAVTDGVKSLDDYIDRTFILSENIQELGFTSKKAFDDMKNLVNLRLGELSGEQAQLPEGGVPTPTERPEGGGELSSAQREMQDKQLEELQKFLMTEQELENQAFVTRLEQLLTFEEEKLITAEEAAVLREELEANHQQKLLDISVRGQGRMMQANLKFIKQIQRAEKQSGLARIGTLTNALQNMTAASSTENRKMFEINKAAGIANAIVSTAQGVAMSLGSLPYPANLLAAAVTGAAGAAQVAAIASTSFGGGGTAPSVGATAAPAVSDVGADGGGGSRGLDVSIQAFDDSAKFSGEQVRELIKGINDEIENGAQITGITVG